MSAVSMKLTPASTAWCSVRRASAGSTSPYTGVRAMPPKPRGLTARPSPSWTVLPRSVGVCAMVLLVVSCMCGWVHMPDGWLQPGDDAVGRRTGCLDQPGICLIRSVGPGCGGVLVHPERDVPVHQPLQPELRRSFNEPDLVQLGADL